MPPDDPACDGPDASPGADRLPVGRHTHIMDSRTPPRPPSAFAGFAITGLIDDDTVEARWIEPVGLVCSPAWRRRAEIVVALGDTFDAGDGTPAIAAAIDGDPTAVALTLLRALDRVTSIRLPPVPHGPP